MTSEDTVNVISSPEPDCGPSPVVSPPGLMLDLFGQPLARASHSAPPERDSASMTQGICGRTYFDSFEPSGPLSSWENRLAARLAMVGSTESALIWKQKTTPAGRSISRLAVSTLHTNGTGFIGSRWQTPSASDGERGGTITESMTGQSLVQQINSQTRSRWPTPRVSDANGTGEHGDGGLDLRTAMSQWPTPTVADVTGGRKTRSGARNDEMLLNGLMSMWRSPNVVDAKGGTRLGAGQVQLTHQIADMFRPGPTPNGSNAQTEKRGAPNPEFACWLMGWPDALTSGALRAIQSFRNLRQKSSRRSGKRSTPKKDWLW
jgi:hypothetical protein